MTELANVPAILTDGTLVATFSSTHPPGRKKYQRSAATSQTVSEQKWNQNQESGVCEMRQIVIPLTPKGIF